jgi:hypothetical protein
MTLENAIKKLVNEFGIGNEPVTEIARLMKDAEIQQSVSQVHLEKLVKLGWALRKAGVN